MKLNLLHITLFSLFLNSCFKEDDTPLPNSIKYIEGEWEFDHFKIDARTAEYVSKDITVNVSEDRMKKPGKYEFKINDHNIYFKINDKDSAKLTFDVLYDFTEIVDGRKYNFVNIELNNENKTQIEFFYVEGSELISMSYLFTRIDQTDYLGPHIYHYGSEKLYFRKK